MIYLQLNIVCVHVQGIARIAMVVLNLGGIHPKHEAHHDHPTYLVVAPY